MGHGLAQPAFVEMDIEKLDRRELVLLGMKEFGDAWVEKLIGQAEVQDSPIIAKILRDVAGHIGESRDDIAVELTRSAVAHKAARLNNIKAEI